MNRARFETLKQAHGYLTLGRLPSKVVHIISGSELLCLPDGKARKVKEVSDDVGPTCKHCILNASQLFPPELPPPPVPVGLASIFLIFGNHCVYCNVDLQHPEITATRDHLIPKSRGGADFPLNLVPACASCNMAKGDKDLSEFVGGDVKRLGEINARIQAGIQKFREQVTNGSVSFRKTYAPTAPQHPGELLKVYFQTPLQLTTGNFAELCGTSAPTMQRLLTGKTQITVELAYKLEQKLGTSAEYWLQIQNEYNLWHLANRTSSSNG